MQAFRTLFWVVTAVIIVLFAMWNWSPVSVKIWPSIGGNSQGLRLDTFLPLVIIGAYLLGAIPVWLLHRASKWSLTRRVENAERELANLRQQNIAATNATTKVDNGTLIPVNPVEPPL